MSNDESVTDEGCDLGPHLIEVECFCGVGRPDAVDRNVEIVVPVVGRMNQPRLLNGGFVVFDDGQTDGARRVLSSRAVSKSMAANVAMF